MNRRIRSFGAPIVVIGLLLLGSAARAGVLWTVEPTAVNSAVISHTGAIELEFTAGPTVSGEGQASFLVGEFTVHKLFENTSDTFTHQNYALNLRVTDVASNTSQTLLFAGTLTGAITPTGGSLDNEFYPNYSAYTFTLDGNDYDVTIGPYQPEEGGEATLRATVKATAPDEAEPPAEEPPPALPTPEPSTLLLVVSALSCGGWAALKRRSR